MNGNDHSFPSGTEVEGLTKREYFAAQALQGLLANPNVISRDGDTILVPDGVGDMALLAADTLLDELNK